MYVPCERGGVPLLSHLTFYFMSFMLFKQEIVIVFRAVQREY